jgi:IS30 family transposase
LLSVCSGSKKLDTIDGKGHPQAEMGRISPLALLRRAHRCTAKLVCDGKIVLLQPGADRVPTITGDNGKVFAEHDCITQEHCSDFTFAYPYAAWERVASDNMNGLPRQFIPKNCEPN